MDIIKRNNVKIIGKGKQPVILAHGFGCNQSMWRYITAELEEHFKLILFDYVGCGESDLNAYHEKRYSTLEGYALDVIEICESLNVEDAIFVGHSVSSMIGVLAHIERPNIFKSMVMVCPSSCYLNIGDYQGGFEEKDLNGLLDLLDTNYVEWANYLAPVVMKNQDQDHLTQELAESFCSMDKVITRNFARVTFFSDNRNDLCQVTIPSIILQCSEDDIAPEKVGEYVHSHLPKSKILYMEATGHCPHMSHPEETLNILLKELIPETV